MRYHAEELRYEKVKIAGTEAFFSDDRIQRDSVPEGLYQYEVRHDDDGLGEPAEIAKGILVNFYGTLLCTERLEEVESQRGCIFPKGTGAVYQTGAAYWMNY